VTNQIWDLIPTMLSRNNSRRSCSQSHFKCELDAKDDLAYPNMTPDVIC
jgi:hypothetical protein